MKTIEKLFGVSVGVISVTTLITTVAGFLGLALPRWALWAIGIVNLISLPLMIYSTVKSLRDKALAARQAAKKLRGSTELLPGAEPAAEEDEEPRAAKKVRPKPHPRQLAVKKAAAGNKPKKGKKKKK